MDILKKITLLFLVLGLVSCQNNHKKSDKSSAGRNHVIADTTLHYPQEKNLANVKQLTFGGDNAEAYSAYCFPGKESRMGLPLRSDLSFFV